MSHPDDTDPKALSRRHFAALSLASGLAATSAAAGAVFGRVADSDVTVPTPNGQCDAAFAHPSGAGNWPAVILFTDIFGLRPTMREMARRLAGNGYCVLVPNPFYRNTRAPGISMQFDFQDPKDRAHLAELRAPLTNEGVASDAKAFMAWLDSQPQVHREAKAGVFGYCMGGPLTVMAAAGVPERIGAGASFHGGGLVTARPDSPHRLVPRLRARFYFAIAANDDQRQPEAKTELAQAFAAAHLPMRFEVYPGTLHGWCVKDMPLQDGKPIYNEPAAERAWHELLVLYREALV